MNIVAFVQSVAIMVCSSAAGPTPTHATSLRQGLQVAKNMALTIGTLAMVKFAYEVVNASYSSTIVKPVSQSKLARRSVVLKPTPTSSLVHYDETSPSTTIQLKDIVTPVPRPLTYRNEPVTCRDRRPKSIDRVNMPKTHTQLCEIAYKHLVSTEPFAFVYDTFHGPLHLLWWVALIAKWVVAKPAFHFQCFVRERMQIRTLAVSVPLSTYVLFAWHYYVVWRIIRTLSQQILSLRSRVLDLWRARCKAHPWIAILVELFTPHCRFAVIVALDHLLHNASVQQVEAIEAEAWRNFALYDNPWTSNNWHLPDSTKAWQCVGFVAAIVFRHRLRSKAESLWKLNLDALRLFSRNSSSRNHGAQSDLDCSTLGLERLALGQATLKIRRKSVQATFPVFHEGTLLQGIHYTQRFEADETAEARDKLQELQPEVIKWVRRKVRSALQSQLSTSINRRSREKEQVPRYQDTQSDEEDDSDFEPDFGGMSDHAARQNSMSGLGLNASSQSVLDLPATAEASMSRSNSSDTVASNSSMGSANSDSTIRAAGSMRATPNIIGSQAASSH